MNEHVLAFIRYLESLLPNERLDILRELPYCYECGGADPNHRCQCWNDE